MGVSFYKCFLCGFTGSEGCFEGDTGDFVSKKYCNDCIEQYFEKTPIFYWVREDDETIKNVSEAYFEEHSRCQWAYSNSAESADFNGYEWKKSKWYPIVRYRPSATFRKKALERIDKKVASLKRFREEIE